MAFGFHQRAAQRLIEQHFSSQQILFQQQRLWINARARFDFPARLRVAQLANKFSPNRAGVDAEILCMTRSTMPAL
jgi:hypothetical protein